MYCEKRPACIKTIGWIWIVGGSLLCFSVIGAIILWFATGGFEKNDGSAQSLLRAFPLIAFIEIVFAIIGIVSGINFLKLRAWSRAVLEGLSWTLLTGMIISMIIFVYDSINMPSDRGREDVVITCTILGVIFQAIFCVPIGIMLKYLKSSAVRDATQETSRI